ncbi:secreted RxLR effector protein 78-like [Nicotiana tomentosiformis]|uniref:secreted RxLR effector protein 78-like n=1 Tax=Nicotiana tomentosiformis TaxID=4098 RepID=UPI001444AE50|nr:secreted RxLR effector protein 78-like [Nicotiana tomentosiformis]
MEEVKNAVIALSGDSASGPDDFTDLFFLQCWDTVGGDYKSGPRQNEEDSTITNFFQPVCFVKGRSIFKNILLTQEIVTDIRLRGKPANVVMKLDMAKADDRVSWSYLLHVLRKMGFAEHFLKLIWNLIANNWHSVLISGQATGFFKSSRGVKQGDPLSPSLFILSAEVLSRSLNKLFEDKKFI